jgi:antitoxin FitA
MATLYVRDIPDSLYQKVQKIAGAQGRSLSAYVQGALEQAIEDDEVRRARSKALASLKRRRRTLPAGAPDSVDMLRQIRGANE